VAIITGGLGFLGRHLLLRLVAAGRWRLAVLDVRPPAVGDADAALPPGVGMLVADLRDAAEVHAALAGAGGGGHSVCFLVIDPPLQISATL